MDKRLTICKNEIKDYFNYHKTKYENYQIDELIERLQEADNILGDVLQTIKGEEQC